MGAPWQRPGSPASAHPLPILVRSSGEAIQSSSLTLGRQRRRCSHLRETGSSPWGVRQTWKVIVSRHAVARYRRRVAPTLPRREALNELRELLAHAERRPDPPLWAATWRAQDARVGQEVTPAVKAPWQKHLVAVN